MQPPDVGWRHSPCGRRLRRCSIDSEHARRCLAERVLTGSLDENYAREVGRQVLRESALSLFPSLRSPDRTDELQSLTLF